VEEWNKKIQTKKIILAIPALAVCLDFCASWLELEVSIVACFVNLIRELYILQPKYLPSFIK
jgi:hypothetical protein